MKLHDKKKAVAKKILAGKGKYESAFETGKAVGKIKRKEGWHFPGTDYLPVHEIHKGEKKEE